MSKPQYFSYFPDVDYVVSANKAGKRNNIKVKDFFHLLRIKDNVYKEDTLYYDYYVKNGQRPEQIAHQEYGDEKFYWIVLQVNDIVDYYNEWPLSYRELDQFILKKYGTYERAGEVAFWETQPTYDSLGNLVMQGGLEVGEDYIYEYPESPGSNVTLTTTPVGVSYREYEERLNEEKSRINLVHERYIADIARDVSNYGKLVKNPGSYLNLADVSGFR